MEPVFSLKCTRGYKNVPMKEPEGIKKSHNMANSNCTELKKKKFTVKVVKLWHRVVREIVEAPALGVFRTGQGLGKPGLRWPCFEQKAGLDDLQR